MAKVPENQLQIGDRVTVLAVVLFGHGREYDDAGNPVGPILRKMDRHYIVPVEMIVVGGAFRKIGIVHPAWRSWDGDDAEPGHLELKEQVFVYHVRRGFMRKIEEALPEDVRCLAQ